jgi:cell division protein FtsA
MALKVLPMVRLRRDSLVVGLDIGTTKICALVAEIRDGKPEVLGVGLSPSKGLRKGVVINIEATVQSIRKAIDDAEEMAGCKIQSVYAGIAGSHIRGFNSQGVVALKDGEVSKEDIERVMAAAKTIAIPIDREIIHVLPQEFVIDDQDGIREPLGMSGVRLEAKVHIVTGAITSAQNIVRCAQRCGLNVEDIVLEQLASANAVLSEDEKELGVALIDIGGGTTDIAVFSKGSIQHTSVIPIGGHHLTNDIAVGLRTPQENAEDIKKRYGTATSILIGKDEVIEVPSIGGRPDRILRRQILSDILEPRIQEIFELVGAAIEKSHLREILASGVVLTGGSAMLPGVVEAAEDILALPVRRGLPRHIGGLHQAVNHPSFATAVGLVLYGAREREMQRAKEQEANLYHKVRRRMGAWIQEMI